MDLLKKLLTLLSFFFLALTTLIIFGSIVSVLIIFTKGIPSEKNWNIKTERAISIVSLDGELMSSKEFRTNLKREVNNDKVKAIVVRIDSPGGTVAASQEVFNSIKQAQQKKPVVCSLGNIAASGGLYSALGCQKIVTNRGTLTGSVGVILMMPNVSSIADRFGVEMTVIKSGKFKDAGSPFRKVTKEDKNLLQTLVNKAHEQFVVAIADSRNLKVDEVRKFADGRIILGEDAVKLGIADEIGGLHRAAELALQLSGGSGEPEVIEASKSLGIWGLIKNIGRTHLPRWISLSTFQRPKLLYMDVF